MNEPDPLLLNANDVKALAAQARELCCVAGHEEYKIALLAIQFGAERLWRLLEDAGKVTREGERET